MSNPPPFTTSESLKNLRATFTTFQTRSSSSHWTSSNGNNNYTSSSNGNSIPNKRRSDSAEILTNSKHHHQIQNQRRTTSATGSSSSLPRYNSHDGHYYVYSHAVQNSNKVQDESISKEAKRSKKRDRQDWMLESQHAMQALNQFVGLESKIEYGLLTHQVSCIEMSLEFNNEVD